MTMRWYTNDIEKKKIEDGNKIPEGYRLCSKEEIKDTISKPFTEERKQKISASTKGRVAHNKGKKEEKKHIYYTNGEISIRIPFDIEPPKGFVRGRLKRKLTKEEKEQFNNKRQKTCIERYGDKNYNNYEKNKLTKFQKYGDENYNNRESYIKTCLNKYGVDNTSKVPYIKEKAHEANKQILLEKYGVSYSFLIKYNTRSKDSVPNKTFQDYLQINGIEIDEREFILENYRYDFKVGNILIEIDPYPYHNSTWRPYNLTPLSKDYHYKKSQIAQEKGYRCIHIFDWDDVDKIISLLKKRENCYARNCEIKEVKKEDAIKFINDNHLQGYAKDKIRIGLYYQEDLVSIMTFDKPRYNKNFEYELIRYCSKYNVVGGAEKLFKYFLKQYSPTSIVSYCDLSKFDGDIYKKLGFDFKKTTIGKHWYNPKTKIHITDNLLRQRGFDQLLGEQYGCYGKGTSNEELMKKYNFVEIYDAGQATYIWSMKN